MVSHIEVVVAKEDLPSNLGMGRDMTILIEPSPTISVEWL